MFSNKYTIRFLLNAFALLKAYCILKPFLHDGIDKREIIIYLYLMRIQRYKIIKLSFIFLSQLQQRKDVEIM